MKKVVILWHNGGRMANQLWLFVSVFAYCLEMGYRLENHCFFEYARYFNFGSNNVVIDILFFKSYVWLKKILPKVFFRNQHDYFFRWYYKIYVKIVERLCGSSVIYADHEKGGGMYYLRPSTKPNIELENFERKKSGKVFFYGWLFRNPVGIEKYRKEIVEYFRPKKQVVNKVNDFVGGLRGRYSTIVGVHMRRGDYEKDFHNGRLFFCEDEVKVFLEDYLLFSHKERASVCFMVCSDGQVDLDKFAKLNVVKTNFGEAEDLYALSQTDIVIGSDSTFGAFASYYGDIPFIVFKKDGVDWSYYYNKEGYFENKYSLLFD